MNILVTGSAGFIGSHLVRKLSTNSDFKISALVRRSAILEMGRENVSVVECDIMNKERLSQTTRNADVAIHLAAVKEHYKNKNIIFSTNVQGTKNLLDCCMRVKQFILASSTLVTNPLDAYSESKKECEQLTRQSGITFTILRFGPVFGSGDTTNLTKIIELIHDGKPIPIPRDGRQLVQPTHVDDVVTAIENSIMNEKLFNRTCVIAGEPISLREFIHCVSRVLDRNPKEIHIPIGILRPIVKVYQKMSESPKITIQQIDNLVKATSSVLDSDFPTSRLDVAIKKTMR